MGRVVPDEEKLLRSRKLLVRSNFLRWKPLIHTFTLEECREYRRLRRVYRYTGCEALGIIERSRTKA